MKTSNEILIQLIRFLQHDARGKDDTSRLLVFGALIVFFTGTGNVVGEVIDFNRDVRPILSDKCYPCHGPDANTRKGKLRLDGMQEAFAKRHNGYVIVPGKPEESLLVQRIGSTDPDKKMPPEDSGKQLTEREQEVLVSWVKQGGRYAGHWAYEKVVRPKVPDLKSLKEPREYTVHPVDAFVQARLEQEGIKPSAQAHRRDMIRRLSFDLTGLPPTPDEVRDFVESDDAGYYEKAVNRLLNSKRFAERFTGHWLDWVRYADSIGYHGDVTYSVWPYRDYVLNSIHGNKPYDQFTREQIAGDLMPGATPEQLVASGYNRLNRISTEGGAQDKEYLAKYAADRVRTASTIWLGTTMGCAECHDHKYDPITTKDFYRFSAFFADLKEKGFYDDGFSKNDWGPKTRLLTAVQRRELEKLDRSIETEKRRIMAVTDEKLGEERKRWEEEVRALDEAGILEWRLQKPVSARTFEGALLTIGTNRIVTASGPNPEKETYQVRFRPGPGRFTAVRLETLTDEVFPGNRVARGGTTFHITELEIHRVDKHGRAKRLQVTRIAADHEGEGYPLVGMLDGKASTSWSITTGHSREHQVVMHLGNELTTDSTDVLQLTIRQESEFPRTTVGKFRISVSSLGEPGIEKWGMPEDVLKAVRTAMVDRTEAQEKLLREHFRKIAGTTKPERRRLEALQSHRLSLLGRVPTSLVSESTKPRTTRILARGNWMDESGEVVTPGVPARFSSGNNDTSGKEMTRLDLANWLVSIDNPLASRAFVNRVWRWFFGVGLSKTLDDLGSQGEWPTHPELLDWLAAEFMLPTQNPGVSSQLRNAWDIKHLIRTIVTSRTYRQASDVRPDLVERDPDNRLLARQQKIRLDAEIIRDNALAVSGLLVENWGGASVYPYQPMGYYAPLNFPKREYVEDRGDNLYRRGLYTHWQRTFPHPSMVAFDAPAREECSVNRIVSNTPLQALVLLNDPTYVEAARVFAVRAMEVGRKDSGKSLHWVFWRALGRGPEEEEIKALENLRVEQENYYRQHPDEARAVLNVGVSEFGRGLGTDIIGVATWTAVTRAILNLNETITRP